MISQPTQRTKNRHPSSSAITTTIAAAAVALLHPARCLNSLRVREWFFVKIRLAFDLGGRESTSHRRHGRSFLYDPAKSPIHRVVRFNRIFQESPRARITITCQSYRDLKQLSSRPASLYHVTMLPPTIGRATFCHVAINH